MSWAALMQGTDYAVQTSGPPLTIKMREVPWSAGAAATAFLPSPLAHLSYEPKAESGSCCYRIPRGLLHSYLHDSGAAAEPSVSTYLVKHNLDKPTAKVHKELPNSRQRSLPGNVLHQASSNKSGGAAKGGLTPNETVHNALPVRTSSVVRPATPSLNNVRHRGPNPAVVGGSPNLHSSNAGAINGTRMNRKP
jgi:hypothetical protein